MKQNNEKEKIKEKVLKEIKGIGFQGNEFTVFSTDIHKLIDKTIQETAKQIFDDIEKDQLFDTWIIGKVAWKQLKKKWCKE